MAANTSGLSGAFKWLNVTQFLGALNDNAFRWLVFFFLVSVLGDVQKESIIVTSTAVFVLPFLLFSHASGVLADRISKRSIIVAAKVMEGIVMALGCGAILTGSAWCLYSIVFLMSTQSALFGPAKYGIIPELVAREHLSKANGQLVGATYLAIILGTFITPFVLSAVFPGAFVKMGLVCVAIAGIGTLTSTRVASTPAVGSEKRFNILFVREVYRTLRSVSGDSDLMLAIVGSSYFLFLGGFIQQNILLYGQEMIGLDWYQSGYLFPVAAVGIGLGALLAGRLSGPNIEFGIVPIGAIGLTACCAAMGLVAPSVPSVVVLAFLIGASSGLFVVPLNAFIQDRSPREIRGQVLACSSFLSFIGVAISAALIRVLSGVLDFNPAQSFLVVSAMTAALVIGTLVILPDFFVRFLVVLLTRTVYRIRIRGIENVPIEGGALLVPNHVSWVDGLLLSATTQRRIRFIMARNIAGWWLLRPIFRLMKVIPISPTDPPRRVVAAFREARQALDDGSLVCIFAEGTITRSGNLNAFKPGFERILRGASYPVVPVYLGGVWGSIFSYYSGQICSSMPRRIPYPVDVLFGDPLPSSSSSAEVERAVGALSCEWFDLRRGPCRTLGQQFVTSARRHWFHPSMCDTTGKRLRYGSALTAAIALSRQVDGLTAGEDRIGVLLPPSVGGALANVAVTLLGKVPVNLNFTASSEAFASAIRQCEIRTVLTSRAFLSRMEGVELPPGLVYLEDLASEIGSAEKGRALLSAMFSPARRLGGGRTVGPDDVATIIFSSGSTAEPKGVVLTHHNILSNIESIAMVFRFAAGDRMCCVLPLFHSFGFTVTLWCPLITGILAAFHVNPLDGEGVARLVQSEKLDFLASTPTFLMAYVRRATREQFASLKSVYVGGEKLTTRVADAFENHFGMRPLEGYGTTELSPVAAFNVRDVERGSMRWSGSREGSIGRPVPGVLMKVVHEGTDEEVAPGAEGLLMVKGANVMAGYLGRDDLTRNALTGGWYRTGDIARIDRDGFVFLLDRQSRFSKLGGEMVPHVAIEDVLTGDCDASHPVVVTGVPDPKKGEQLVVLYTDEAGDLAGLHRAVRQSALPNLWRPKERNYFHVDKIPVLGSGKLDLKKIRTVARELVDGKPGVVQSVVNRLRETLGKGVSSVE